MPAGRYDAPDIEVLDGLEAVRRRPHLYVGDLSGSAALTHLVLEPLCLAVDGKTGGPALNVRVVLQPDDSAEVHNDGPGLPLRRHPTIGLTVIEVIMTKLHACRAEKAGTANERWCGVGISVVNALAEWCVVTTRSEGGVWQQRFERGRAVTGLERRGDSSDTGTSIAFKPERQLLTGKFNAEAIQSSLHQFQTDVPCVAVTFADLRTA